MEELTKNMNDIRADANNMVLKWDDYLTDVLKLLDSKFFDKKEDETCKTPKQAKKKVKRLTTIEDSEESLSENAPKFIRPMRTAKGKAFENLKEPLLNSKMRRDSIKKERISTDQSENNLSKVIENKENMRHNNSAKLKKSDLIENRKKTKNVARNTADQLQKRKSNDSDVNRSDQEPSNSKKIGKDDESLIIIANDEVKIELLSEDESEKMPPPPLPPKALGVKRSKKKKIIEEKIEEDKTESQAGDKKIIENDIFEMNSEDNSKELRITRSRIKQESLDTLSQSSKGKTTKEGNKNTNIDAQQSPPDTNNNDITKMNTPDTSELNYDLIEKPNKNIPFTVESALSNDSPNINNEEQAFKALTPLTTTVANITQESVYEDALVEIGRENVSKEFNKIYNAVVVIENISVATKQMETSKDTTFCLHQNDATFVTTNPTPQPPPYNNNSNETFNILPDTNNGIEDIGNINVTNSSLITEDSSIPAEESSTEIVEASIQSHIPIKLSVVRTTDKTNQNELFNPLIQSPVKKKVEAFEKHTNFGISPIPTRVTRTKTKEQKLHKENIAETIQITPATKIWTPVINQQFKKSFLSASKLAHSQKIIKTSSRDNSTEDMKRGLLALTEEKKRKRDEKQRLAQQQREAKEKERIELAEKLAKERELKYKRLMQEKEEKLRVESAKKKLAKEIKLRENENKKQLEEIQKNIKIQEQKRDEMILFENQKRIAAQLYEAARREKQAHEMRANAAKEEFRKKLQQKLNYENKKKIITGKHDFEALNSGDSTDEEEKVSNKKAPPPEWSRSSNRRLNIQLQSLINTKIIDNFFSVQPMSPDLREIFPEINSKYLKRNSSAVWNTPPRYSEMPKY